mgnify:CR=1 FL=1
MRRRAIRTSAAALALVAAGCASIAPRPDDSTPVCVAKTIALIPVAFLEIVGDDIIRPCSRQSDGRELDPQRELARDELNGLGR